MPKLIDYPRTTYSGAWEIAEITDDTGGKCAIETAARKLNRKVSGSFKAIIGSAVKFGLLTSKRDLLTTTTLFKRIKHAYDKQEELAFHREAFLTPPLFTQLCRKFRSRELPVQMLDVMLIREFGVEEINAQGVAKAFVEGCRMVGLLDEHNIVADIDALTNKPSPRRELASPPPIINTFRGNADNLNSDDKTSPSVRSNTNGDFLSEKQSITVNPTDSSNYNRTNTNQPDTSIKGVDAIASLFGLLDTPVSQPTPHEREVSHQSETAMHNTPDPVVAPIPVLPEISHQAVSNQSIQIHSEVVYQIQVSGPGVNTILSISEEEDIAIAMALLQKISRQLKAKS
ncbi:hypothetical protein I2I05_16160 [Hymenobacter sp. BT683]|uniref:Uncharacterized protein n=1 Tax=Hymenobacter jeongseonensis TaxID=2791027 RepID=A0ABS0IKP3_9BACT|nr:hypothetical protein [Hymenobacter jeongseonensis]MBF9238938.1 hypothetical protein [Hymenobacter jeongseonensis]